MVLMGKLDQESNEVLSIGCTAILAQRVAQLMGKQTCEGGGASHCNFSAKSGTTDGKFDLLEYNHSVAEEQYRQ